MTNACGMTRHSELGRDVVTPDASVRGLRLLCSRVGGGFDNGQTREEEIRQDKAAEN